jgi:hypothetical protein
MPFTELRMLLLQCLLQLYDTMFDITLYDTTWSLVAVLYTGGISKHNTLLTYSDIHILTSLLYSKHRSAH